MSRFATLATLNVDDALPDAWVDEVKVFHDYYTQAGADLASAASIAITAAMHNVTGTTTITTITDAAGLQKGQELYLRFVTGLQLGTSGNIQTLSGAASIYGASDVAHLLYDGVSKWIEIASGDPLDLNQTATQVLSSGISIGGAVGTAGGSGTAGSAFNLLGDIFSVASSNRAWLNSSIVSDTVNRFSVTTVGVILWGTGALAADAQLSRAAVGQLFVNAKVLEALPAVATGTVPTTFTPALATGLTQRFSVTAGGAATLTIAAPTTPPSSTQSCFMYMRISNTGGGTVTLSWNAIYAAGTVTALPASVATGSNVNILWVWEGTLWRILVVS